MESRPGPPRYDDVTSSGMEKGNIYNSTTPYPSTPYMPSNGPGYGPETMHRPPPVVHVTTTVHVASPAATGPLPELSRKIVALHFVNSATHFFLGAVVFSAFSMANRYSFYPNSFSTHIFLCVTGYVILVSQAIVSLNPFGGWANRLNISDRKMVHAILQIVGSILAITGCIIRITDRRYNAYYNAHGIFGWIAMVLTFLSFIGGVINYKKSTNENASLFKTGHRYLGVLTITVAFITMCIGFDNFDRYYYHDASGILAITFTVCALLGILISTFAKNFIAG